jgi:hypothetical protein
MRRRKLMYPDPQFSLIHDNSHQKSRLKEFGTVANTPFCPSASTIRKRHRSSTPPLLLLSSVALLHNWHIPLLRAQFWH